MTFKKIRFSLSDIKEAYKVIDPYFLNTSQFVSDVLSGIFECEVILKIETLNPIRSFKGRGCSYLLSKAMENEIICASAGNFGQGMAYMARENGIMTAMRCS